MAKKTTEAAQSAQQPEMPAQQTADSGGSKADKIRSLLEDWSRQGKDLGSNKALVDELQRRHPGLNVTAGDVAQNKGKWFKSRAVPGGSPPPAAPAKKKASEAAAQAENGESPFIGQLRQAVALLGKEAVKKLVDGL